MTELVTISAPFWMFLMIFGLYAVSCGLGLWSTVLTHRIARIDKETVAIEWPRTGKTCPVTDNTCADDICPGDGCFLATTPEGKRALDQGES